MFSMQRASQILLLQSKRDESKKIQLDCFRDSRNAADDGIGSLEALPIKPGIGDGIRTFQELLEIRLREHQDSPRLKKLAKQTDENAAEVDRFQTPYNRKIPFAMNDRFQSSTKNLHSAQRTFLKKGEGLKRFAAFKAPLLAPKLVSRRQTFVKFKVDGSRQESSQEQLNYHDSITSEEPKCDELSACNKDSFAAVPSTPRSAFGSLQTNTDTNVPTEKCFIRKIKPLEPLPKDAMTSFRQAEKTVKPSVTKEKNPPIPPKTTLKKASSLVMIEEASPEGAKEELTTGSNPESPKPRYNLRGSRKPAQPKAQNNEDVIPKTRGRRGKKQPAAIVERHIPLSESDTKDSDSGVNHEHCDSDSDSKINEDQINDLLNRIKQKKSALDTQTHESTGTIPNDESACVNPPKGKSKSKKNIRLDNGYKGSKLDTNYDNAKCSDNEYTSSSSSIGDYDQEESNVELKCEADLHGGLASPKLGSSFRAMDQRIDQIQASIEEIRKQLGNYKCGPSAEERINSTKEEKTSRKVPKKSGSKDSEMKSSLLKQIDELRQLVIQS